MRPLRLVMQAFGPYVERQEIDFTALGTRQFFLVHGPTGAGKTTIFDAICYALYGATSGAERDAKHMRSDYAPVELDTEVVLDFAVGSERYRVRRTPPREVPKKRGDGMRLAPGTAELAAIDAEGREVQSLGDKYVNQKIVDIIGFEVSQFRQVVLLPQGDFRKLLLAGSDEREAILSRLFATDIFARVTERLRDQARELTETYREHNTKRESYLAVAEVESVEALDAQSRACEEAVRRLQAEAGVLHEGTRKAQQELAEGRRQDERFGEQEQKQRRRAQLERLRPEMDACAALLGRLQHAAEMQDRYTAWQALTETGKDIRAQWQEVQAHLPEYRAKAEYWQQERQVLRDTAAEQEQRVQELADLRRRDENRRRLQDIERQAAAAAQAAQTAQAALAAAEQRKVEADAALAECENERQNNRTVLALEQTAQQTATNARRQLQAYDAWRQAEDEARQAEQVLAECTAKAAAAETGAVRAKTAWERIVFLQEQDRLATLAADLTDGTPCPVCGACEHPRPALAAEYVPSAAEEEAARVALQSAQETLQAWHTRRAECSARAEQLRAESRRRGEEIGTDTRETLMAALADAERLLHDVEAAQAAQPGLERDCQQAQTAAAAAAQACEKAQADNRDAETTAARLAERACALAEEVPEAWRDGNELTQRLTALEQDILAYRRRREACDTRAAADEEAYRRAAQQEEDCRRRLAECRERYQTEKDALTERALALGLDSLAAVGEALTELPRRQEYEQKVADYQLECRRMAADLAALAQELDGRARPDVDALVQAEAAAVAAETAKQRELTQAQEQQKQYVHWGNLYRRESEAIARLDAEHAVVGRLAALAGGTDTSAAAKMTFQRYVLGAILDEVLVLANSRLQDMSHHRYQLKREMRATDRRSTEGLELAVIDRWTGNVRPVNTLSGGETFLASLALALGLADTAQAYAGGLRMDMMLIDEGFGTLDGEALDEAIRVLLELRTGGRLVGIISHVDELRRRIDTRLEIQKTEQGSRARWVLG